MKSNFDVKFWIYLRHCSIGWYIKVLLVQKQITTNYMAYYNTHLLSYSFWGQKSGRDLTGLKSRCWQGCIPFGSSRGKSISFPTSRSCPQSLAHSPSSYMLHFSVSFFYSHIFLKKFFFICLILVVLKLCCCTGIFSSCSMRASHCSGFSCRRAWALGAELR